MSMRPVFALAVIGIISFGLLGPLGLFAMSHGASGTCPIPLFTGGDCPPAEAALAHVFHHASAAQDLAQPALAINVLLAALVVFLVRGYAAAAGRLSIPRRHTLPTSVKKTGSILIPKLRFNRWLAVLRSRDPYALSGAHDAC